MKFLTLGVKEITDPVIYNRIQEKHIVISISGIDDKETVLPNNVSRVGQLHVKFDDIEDVLPDYLYFNRGLAEEILDFVERHCTKISLIIVQCQAGLSRSVGTAAALAKIINGRDDDVFTKGIPNMFVYTTILDYFFSDPVWDANYPKISTVRNRELGKFLSPAMIRLYSAKNRRRNNV